MADLSKVKVGGEVYNLKDAEARTRLTAAEAELLRLEADKQDVIDASNKLEAAYVSLDTPSGSKLKATDVQEAIYELEDAIETGGTGSVVNVVKKDTAETGYFATYEITQGGTKVGASINIPKDFLVKSAELKTVTKADEPYSGAKVGDKYIDFVINVKDGTATDEHIYLPVNELVDAYAGDETSIHMENNTFSVKAVAMDKVTGLTDALELKADQTDLEEAVSGLEAEIALKVDESALGDLAYKDSAEGTVPGQTISGVKATGDLEGSAAITIASTSTAASLTKADFTPAGSITGSAISGGSINVTVKDAAAATAVTDITYSAYTPAGNVTLEKAADGAFQVSGSVSKPAINVNDDAVDTFVKSLKAGNVDAASFTEGAFTPASISEGFFSAGSQASYTHTGFDGGKLEKGSAVQAAIEGIVASVGSGDDAETLILTAAQKDNVMDFDAAFTAATYGTDNFVTNTLPSINTSKFNGGSKAADTFSANKLPVVNETASAVTEVTAELAAAPTFTGDKFNPAFAGTSADIKFAGAKYLKQEIDAKEFTSVAATLGFQGTKAANVLVTGVNYDKANASQSGTVAITGASLNVGDIAVAATTVTVE